MRGVDLVNALMSGAMVMASAAIGLFFLRFWRRSRDRLFLMFAIAFWVYGINRLALSLMAVENEGRTYLYGVRALVFLLIVLAVVDKNRRGDDRPSDA